MATIMNIKEELQADEEADEMLTLELLLGVVSTITSVRLPGLDIVGFKLTLAFLSFSSSKLSTCCCCCCWLATTLPLICTLFFFLSLRIMISCLPAAANVGELERLSAFCRVTGKSKLGCCSIFLLELLLLDELPAMVTVLLLLTLNWELLAAKLLFLSVGDMQGDSSCRRMQLLWLGTVGDKLLKDGVELEAMRSKKLCELGLGLGQPRPRSPGVGDDVGVIGFEGARYKELRDSLWSGTTENSGDVCPFRMVFGDNVEQAGDLLRPINQPSSDIVRWSSSSLSLLVSTRFDC